MIPSQTQADAHNGLMAEFRRLRDETQPIHNDLMAFSSLQNPRGDSSNEPLTSLLRELQLMRTEMKQIQNDVKEIRMEVAEVKQKLEVVKNNQEELRRNQEIVKGNQEFVKKCLQEVKTSHVDLKKTVTDNAANLNILRTKMEEVSTQIDKMTEKVPETSRLPTIKEQFSGKWQCTAGDYNGHLSLKFVDNKLIIKRELSDRTVYTLGVQHSNGWTTHLEGEKIVQTRNSWKTEYYLENGSLVFQESHAGDRFTKYTFTRIGDPDV